MWWWEERKCDWKERRVFQIQSFLWRTWVFGWVQLPRAYLLAGGAVAEAQNPLMICQILWLFMSSWDFLICRDLRSTWVLTLSCSSFSPEGQQEKGEGAGAACSGSLRSSQASVVFNRFWQELVESIKWWSYGPEPIKNKRVSSLQDWIEKKTALRKKASLSSFCATLLF